MRFRSNKGFTGIELIMIIGIIGLVSYFAAPAVGKSVNNIFTGDKNKTRQVHKVTEQYSMFYKDEKGNFKPAPIPYKRTEDSLNYINTEPPETIWTKFWHLGAIAVIIIILLSYLGLWPIITLWWNKKIKPKIEATQAQLETLQGAHAELTDDAKRIVLSVDEGLAVMDAAITAAKDEPWESTLVQLKQDFLTAMSRKQDSTTKKLVALLKND